MSLNMSSNTVEKESREDYYGYSSSPISQTIDTIRSRSFWLKEIIDKKVKRHVTLKGLEKMLEAVSFITAFMGAIFFSTMCNFTYEDYRAADERISRFHNVSVWIITFGYWSVSLFYLSLVISLVLYVDLVIYTYDGDEGNDQNQAYAWFILYSFWLFFLVGITLIAMLSGVFFTFLMGFLLMNKSQSNTFGWRVAGYLFVLTIIVLLIQVIYFQHSDDDESEEDDENLDKKDENTPKKPVTIKQNQTAVHPIE